MSGKFVSSGTIDNPTERDDAWRKAEQELEERRAERERNKAAHDGKTLFEVLQANKAAKEEAFQESIKLKNQFRALNDDEVDFLESHVEARKAKEDAIRQETMQQLQAFRQKQEEANRIASAANPDDVAGGDLAPELDAGTWTGAKKRKRTKEKDAVKAIKVRRGSSGAGPKSEPSSRKTFTDKQEQQSPKHLQSGSKMASKNTDVAPEKKGLGLVAYDSNDDSS